MMNNLSKEQICAKVCAMVKEVLRVEGEVTEATDFAVDLEADSLDVMELIMAIEDTFAVRVDDEAALKVRTVGDVVAALAAM